jgi:hypothetical protein
MSHMEWLPAISDVRKGILSLALLVSPSQARNTQVYVFNHMYLTIYVLIEL